MTLEPRPLEEGWLYLAQAGDPGQELRATLEAALERNARDVTILDLRGLSDVTDFFLITTGDSDRHVRAISDNILEKGREAGHRPVGIEGVAEGDWILLDFVSIIVHIFQRVTRLHYRLERLWGDAPSVVIE